MAHRWTPPDPSVPRSAPLRDPPLVSSAERERRLRERGVPEHLLQLLDEPERALEHALRPDPEVATDLETRSSR